MEDLELNELEPEIPADPSLPEDEDLLADLDFLNDPEFLNDPAFLEDPELLSDLDFLNDPEFLAEPEPPEDPVSPADPEPPAEQEQAASPSRSQRKKLKRIVYSLLLAVFLTVFIGCALYIVDYMVESQQVSGIYNDLSDLRQQYTGNDDTPAATLPDGVIPTLPNGDPDPDYILPELQELYAQNNDLVGWISIPDTKVDYPVVQTPGNANYYLYRNFEGKDSKWGCIYVREACDVFTPSDNVVLYGHHMEDGSMFGALEKYRKKDFWEEHQYITFDTLYERHTYQIIAVFKTTANEGGFSYHTFNNAANEEEFNAFMKKVHSLEYYSTGLTAEYGDMLLTLSTCEYTQDNGRFVVLAKRID